MRATIKNNSTAPQGVHTTSGLIFIDPGRSAVLDVAPNYVERVKALAFFKVTFDEPDEDGDADMDRDALKAEAKALGISHAKNITTERLAELIEEHRAA